MNYWHIQMHPGDQEEFDRKRVTQLLKETGLVGVGDWEDGASKIRLFVEDVAIGDIMLVRSTKPLALVEIVGESEYDETARGRLDWFEYRRQVKVLAWYSEAVGSKFGRTVDGIWNGTSFSIVNHSDFIIKWHRQIMSEQKMLDVAELLFRKKQVILQGPPGTGKTRLAKQIAEHLTSDPSRQKLIQFHPAYAYEDFVRGIVAETTDGTISYRAENKVLGEFAARAAADLDNDYVMIIDEINRANLPSVLGELIYALEYRGEEVESVYGLGTERSRKLQLPENLLIIGTMNKADRSVGHLDYAIRRRFAFVQVLPDESVVSEGPARRLYEQVQKLMEEYRSLEFDLNDVRPGHSYFLTSDKGLTLKQKLDYELRPLLEEYRKDGILLEASRQAIADLSV
jgi:DNA polymerase III delta prime subunit